MSYDDSKSTTSPIPFFINITSELSEGTSNLCNINTVSKDKWTTKKYIAATMPTCFICKYL